MIRREVLRELKKKKLRIEEEKMAFKEEVRISHKVMGSAKISHSCGFPRQRACFFENWSQKRIRTRFAFL